MRFYKAQVSLHTNGRVIIEDDEPICSECFDDFEFGQNFVLAHRQDCAKAEYPDEEVICVWCGEEIEEEEV